MRFGDLRNVMARASIGLMAEYEFVHPARKPKAYVRVMTAINVKASVHSLCFCCFSVFIT